MAKWFLLWLVRGTACEGAVEREQAQFAALIAWGCRSRAGGCW